MSENIFFKYKNNIAPSGGCILVSEPHLPDNNFDRSVVLLCKHDDEGSFGFVLNKESNVNLEELLPDAEGIKSPINIGGPVEQNTLHFIHNDDTLENAERVTENLYWGGNFNLLLSWLQEGVVDRNLVKFFLGYSGWAAGQLMDEIAENSWIVYKPEDTGFIFDINSKDMWKSLLESMGGRYSMYSKYPIDPRLN